MSWLNKQTVQVMASRRGHSGGLTSRNSAEQSWANEEEEEEEIYSGA